MKIRKYKGTAFHFMCAISLAVVGILMILVAMFLPPVGAIDPSVCAAFGEILTFAGAITGMDYKYGHKNDLS